MTDFTQEEAKILAPFVTNLERPVFGLKNLPEAIKGALFSRYSRSPKVLRRLLLDEFIKDPKTGFAEISSFDPRTAQELTRALKKAESFYDRILDGYGDDSVGELGAAHIACEKVSMIATKYLEDPRLGGSPLEKSTRYVWFNDKVEEEYQFYQEPILCNSKFKELYLNACRTLFKTYEDLMDPMTSYVQKHFPLDEFNFFDIRTKKEIPFMDLKDEKITKRAKIAYRSSVRAKVCDALRSLLPASALTNLGIFGNGRFFQGLLTRLYSEELTELSDLSASMHEELNQLIPSFVKRGKRDHYKVETQDKIIKLSKELLKDEPKQSSPVVDLIEYDDKDELMIAKMMYPNSNLSLSQLRTVMARLGTQTSIKVVETYAGKRASRRDKPGRALEDIYYTFDILADFGIYRDLQRHRILTQERQHLTTVHGYVIPKEIEAAGFKKKFTHAMQVAKDAYAQIYKHYPREAQYVVPMAYMIRWYFKLNLREAMHLIELRSTPQGHPEYRKIVQLMYKEIEKVHPQYAKMMNFVDLNDYPLGRMSSELKKEEKKEIRELPETE